MKVLLFMVHIFLFLLLKKLYCDYNAFNIKCAIRKLDKVVDQVKILLFGLLE